MFENETFAAEWIVKAIKIIASGIANKLEKHGIKAYAVGDKLIRIDIPTSIVGK